VLKTPKRLPTPVTHRPATGGLRAAVRAVGLARLDPSEVAAFRRKPAPIPEGWKPIAPTFLKASDEQSVAAVAAVLSAITKGGVEAEPSAFAEWGVVAASCHLGRSQLVVALRRFAEEGVWGVSPHLIPHYALHSPAGTLSLALGAHGPNLGVGGGPGSMTEGALTALTWLSEGRLPGVWLVVTGHDPVFVPGPNGEPTTPSVCQAFALALEPFDGTTRRPILQVAASDGSGPSGPLDFLDLHAQITSMIEDDASLFGPDPDAPSTFSLDEGTGLRLEWSVDAEREAW
jgi:hypothetical protein